MDAISLLLHFLLIGSASCQFNSLLEQNIELNQKLIKQSEFDINGLSDSDMILSLIIESSIIQPSEVVIAKQYEVLFMLVLRNCSLTRFDIRKPMDSLQHLDLSFNLLREVDFLAKFNWKLLQHLDLRDNRISSFKVSFFKQLVRLQTIDVSNNDISAIDSSMLCVVPTLRSVQVSYNVNIANPCDRVSVIRDATPPLRPEPTVCEQSPSSGNQCIDKQQHKEVSPASTTTAPEIPTTLGSIKPTENLNQSHISLLYILVPIVLIIVVLLIIIIVLIYRNRHAKGVPAAVSPPFGADADHYDTCNPDYIYSTPPHVFDGHQWCYNEDYVASKNGNVSNALPIELSHF